MAIVDPTELIFAPEVVITEGRLGPAWSPDVTETEEHSSSIKPTRLPVESGANVTDHILVDPDRLVLTIVVSNDDPNFLSIPNFPGGPQRDLDAYKKLKNWQTEGTLLNISTSLRPYDNMLLTELSAPRSSDNGDALLATATFEPFITVKTRRQSYQVKKASSADKPVKPAAKVAPKPVDNRSFLKTLEDAVGAGG